MRLSDSHRQHLAAAAIDPTIVAERGTFSALRGRDVPQNHGRLPTKPGMVFPVHTLDGGTFCRLRPNNPGRLPKYMQPKGHPNRLDIHPRQHERIKRPGGMRYVTEGEKKTDAGVSHGLLMVGQSGVFNGQRDKGASLIDDWHELPLEGEEYAICYDSDLETNGNVQLAADRLARLLQAEGAKVFITLLPPAPGGGKQGLDDFFANGGTVRQLELLTRPYDPETVERVRLTRDDKLRAAVEGLERQHADADWTAPGGDADEDLYLALKARARKHGKPHPDGVWVTGSWGALGFEAKIGSSRTVGKSLDRLEARDLLYRDNEGRKEGKPGAFVLRSVARAGVKHMGESNADEGKATKSLQESDPSTLHPRAPRLWASRPKFKPTKKMIRKHRLGTLSYLPESREGVKRLGKKRSHVFDRLDAAGGALALDELGRMMGVRPRDLTRRKKTDKGRDGLLIWPEEAGIVAVEGGMVSLAPDWLERLEEQRERGEELEADEQAARDRKRRSLAYRDHLERLRGKSSASKPSAAGLAAIKRSRESKAAGLAAIAERAAAAAKAEELRKAEAFVRDRLRELGRIRLALLEDIWHDAGGDPWTIPQAVEALGCRIEPLPEFDNRRFVFAPAEQVA